MVHAADAGNAAVEGGACLVRQVEEEGGMMSKGMSGSAEEVGCFWSRIDWQPWPGYPEWMEWLWAFAPMGGL